MATASGVVTRLDSKEVKARGRATKTYSFQLDDKWWYRTNFEQAEIEEGDQVEFKYEEDKWGKNVTPSDIKVIAKGVAAPKPAPKAAGGRSTGTFPIPALDGQRSIVRQNSLTHATNVVLSSLTPELWDGKRFEDIASEIIKVATQFEAYSCGDLEMKALEDAAKAE